MYNNIFAEVDKFIEQLHNGDIEITSKAGKLQAVIHQKSKIGLATEKHVGNLADLLGWSIGAYLLNRNNPNPQLRLEIAYECLDYIERARTHGVIRPLNLTKKLKECEEQNERLKDNQKKLETEVLKLKRENEELHKILDQHAFKSTVPNNKGDESGKL